MYTTPLFICRKFAYAGLLLACIQMIWLNFGNLIPPLHFPHEKPAVEIPQTNTSTFLLLAPKHHKSGRLWPVDDIMPTEKVREYFKNTLLIVMMSPPRYHLVRVVRRHYAEYFRHIFFCGPKNSTEYGIRIRGYIVKGGHQTYRAVSKILSEDYMREDEGSRSGRVRGQLKRGLGSAEDSASATYNNTNVQYGAGSETVQPTHSTPRKDSIDGALYVCDDVLLHPWSLAAKGFDKGIPWANQMGIGNPLIYRGVGAVKGMAIEKRFRQQGWPWWKPSQVKILKFLTDAGEEFRSGLALSANATPYYVKKASRYKASDNNNKKSENGARNENKNQSSTSKHTNSSNIDDYLKWTTFYTITDSFYIPRRMWGDFCEAAEVMAKHALVGEIGIPTAFRAMSPTYEEMNVQFYWSNMDPGVCSRFYWDINTVDGIHRCSPDHEFFHAVFSNDSFRRRILHDRDVKKYVMGLSKLSRVMV